MAWISSVDEQLYLTKRPKQAAKRSFMRVRLTDVDITIRALDQSRSFTYRAQRIRIKNRTRIRLTYKAKRLRPPKA